MERKVPFVEHEYYHLYNRGVDKRQIFSSPRDYERFIALLYLANQKEGVRMANLLRTTSYKELLSLPRESPLVAVGAFCLMPNHFHLLVTPLVENGVSCFLLKVQTGYSMYFNTKYKRSGSLFQGPYKSSHAHEDRYLKYLFSYIHLNPAKLKDSNWKSNIHLNPRKLGEFVSSYPYSSLSAYLADAHVLTDPKAFPEYFLTKNELLSHMEDWLYLEQGLPLLKNKLI